MSKIEKILAMLTSKTANIQRLSVERTNQNWFVDIVYNNFIININVNAKNIYVITSSAQHLISPLESGEQEMNFHSVDELGELFERLSFEHRKLSVESTNYIVYKGKSYPFDVEITEIDTERQMGTEVLYDVSIYDIHREQVVIASISEYPEGIFSIFESNRDAIFSEENLISAARKLSTETNGFEEFIYE